MTTQRRGPFIPADQPQSNRLRRLAERALQADANVASQSPYAEGVKQVFRVGNEGLGAATGVFQGAAGQALHFGAQHATLAGMRQAYQSQTRRPDEPTGFGSSYLAPYQPQTAAQRVGQTLTELAGMGEGQSTNQLADQPAIFQALAAVPPAAQFGRGPDFRALAGLGREAVSEAAPAARQLARSEVGAVGRNGPIRKSFAQYMDENGLSGPLDEIGSISPSAGRVSKHSNRVAERRSTERFAKYMAGKAEYQRLVDEGQIIDPTGKFTPTPPAPPAELAEIERLRRQASDIRGLAERGMRPKAGRREAERLEAQAAELESRIGKAQSPAAESAVAKPAREADVSTGLAGAPEPPAVARAPQGPVPSLMPQSPPQAEAALSPASTPQEGLPPSPPSAAGGVPPAQPPVLPVATGGGVPPAGGVPPVPATPANPFGFRNPVSGLTRSQRIANVVRSTLHLAGHNENEISSPIMAERARLRPIVASTANRLGTLTQERARTLFTIAKDGTIPDLKGVDTTIAGAPTIQDIAARFPVYEKNLTPEQRTFIEDLGKKIQTYSDALKAQGVDIPAPRADVMEGGYYLPRGSAAVGGVDEPIKIRAGARSGIGKPGFLKSATFASQSEGIGAGYEYPPLAEAVRNYVRELGNKAVDTYSANLLKAATDATGSPYGRVLAKGEGPSRTEGIAGLSGLENRAFPDAMANAVNKTIKAEGEPRGAGSALLRVQDTLNNWYRGVRATGDDSALAIQGLLGAATDPKATAQAWKVNFKAWGNEGDRVLAQFISDYDKQAVADGLPTSEELVTHGLHLGGAETEFQLGTQGTGVSNLPGLRQANRAFGYLGDSLRLSWARDAINDEIRGFGPLKQPRTLAEIRASGDLDRITNAVNVMTGWSANPTGASVGKTLLFAPRWFQSRLETVGKAALSLRPGGSTIDRRMARNSLLKLVAEGTTLTVAINTALGQETDFRPIVRDSHGKLRYNSTFMRIKWNGTNWSVFGPWDSLARMIVNTGLSVQNPKLALDAYRGVSSGVISNAIDLFNGKDYNYNPITDSPVHLAEYFLQDLVPFSGGAAGAGLLQSGEGAVQGNPTEALKGAGTAALQFVGIKGTPQNKASSKPSFTPSRSRSIQSRGAGIRDLEAPKGTGLRRTGIKDLEPAGAR